MVHEINRLAEIKDKNREKEFHDNEVRKGLRISRNLILIFGVVNLLYVLGDYFFLEYDDTAIVIYFSLIPRIVALIMAIGEFTLLKKAENKTAAIKSVIIFVILIYLLHEYTAMHFAPVALIFEILDLVLATFCLFIIPNRWITNVYTSVFLIVIFIVLTPLTIPGMTEGIKILITLYLLTQVLIVSTLMYQIGIQKRLNYLQQLQFEVLAKTDMLTKTYNRAACDKILDRMCESNCEFSIILLDFDDFKQINDNYGHIAGDEVIVKTVDTIKRAIRKDDFLARWGGEEFVIILPNATLEEATEMAGRIKELLSLTDHDDTIGKVTASFGVTPFIQGDNTKSIILRADQLLYMAKERGKNQVVPG